MLIAAALTIALAVWVLVPTTSSGRLAALESGRQHDIDVVRTWLRRRKRVPGPSLLVTALRMLSSELRAGSTPGEALERAAGDPPLWPHALAAARFGDRVDQGLRLDAERREDIAGPLRQFAACWHVGVTRGSGLAVSVDRLAVSLRVQQELQSTLRSELAAPRATARMLGLLPVIGIVMGYLLGADPLGWFLGSPVGVMVLACAFFLTLVGVIWTRRIVRRVERGLL